MTTTDAALKPGQVLGRHPKGAIAQAYLADGRLWTALHLTDGMVVPHPDGGWGVFSYEQGRTRRVSRHELSWLTEIRPSDDLPPLLPIQAGLFDHQPPLDPAPDLFRRWTMAELLDEPDEFTWLIQGLLADPTYGQVAGEMKSLKTYLAAMIQVGLAAGRPILGRFTPPAPRPVLAYIGEGGRRPYTRRLRRIAAAMGVDLASIPLHISTDVAPIQSETFACSI